MLGPFEKNHSLLKCDESDLPVMLEIDEYKPKGFKLITESVLERESFLHLQGTGC